MSAQASDGTRPERAFTPLDQMTATFLTETLGTILTSAQESVADMVRRAEAMSEERIAEASRVHASLQEEYERFRTWRVEIQPLLDATLGRARAIQAGVEDTVGRVRDSMKPLTDAVSAVEDAMGEFLKAPPPPTPPPLDLGRAADLSAPAAGVPAAQPEPLGVEPAAMDAARSLTELPDPPSEPEVSAPPPEPEPEPAPEPAPAPAPVGALGAGSTTGDGAPPTPAVASHAAAENGVQRSVPDAEIVSYAWVNDGRKFKVLASETVSEPPGAGPADSDDGAAAAPDEPRPAAPPVRKTDPNAAGWVPKRAEEIDWSDLPGLDADPPTRDGDR